MKDLWTEKYRPSNVDGYVFRDNKQKEQVKQWITEGALPHLLFSGAPGTGKTTLAKIIINNIDWVYHALVRDILGLLSMRKIPLIRKKESN